MKSSVISAVLLVATAVSCGGTIEITAQDVGQGRLRIGYRVVEGADVPAAFSFYIGLSNSATIDSVLYANPLFPVCPDTVVFDGSGVLDYGDPVVGNKVQMAIDVLERPADPRGDSSDIDADGFVNHRDAMILFDGWGMVGPSFADINGDAQVDLVDYCVLADSNPAVGESDEILLLQLARGAGDTTTVSISPAGWPILGNGGTVVDVIMPELTTVVVPEPATVLLLGLGGLVLRRRQ